MFAQIVKYGLHVTREQRAARASGISQDYEITRLQEDLNKVVGAV